MPIARRGALTISYSDEGAGAPAVLLHSGGLSSRQWGRLAARLRATRRVIAPDLLGYGESSAWPADAPFELDEDARMVEALLDTLEGPFDLVGHSYGGLLALRVASRRPAEVRSLALFEPVAFGVLHDPRDEVGIADLTSNDRDGTFLDDATGGGEAWLERFVDYWNGAGAWRSLPQASRDAFLAVGRKVFLEVRSLLGDRTRADAYRAIVAPALLLTGSRSPIAAQRVCARLGAALPRAVVRTLDGAGHMGPITHAAAVNNLIAEHLASIDG